MSADVQMNYDTMEEMAKIFQNGSQQLQETGQAMEQLAGMMSEGGLLGEGGEKFADALRSRLSRKIHKLAAKFSELSKDVDGAVKDLRDGDKNAASRFKG